MKRRLLLQGLVKMAAGALVLGALLFPTAGTWHYDGAWRLLALLFVPMPVVGIGAALFLAAYGLYIEVMRENAYLSRTVEVQAGQKVIDTGLYGVVRHPMYGAVTILFLSMPLVLGSAAALIPFLFLPAVLVKRIKNEEQVLEAGLAGYREYKQRVHWRMVPFLW